MSEIHYIDRLTKKRDQEKVYGKFFLEVLYSKGGICRFFSFFSALFSQSFPFFLVCMEPFKKVVSQRLR